MTYRALLSPGARRSLEHRLPLSAAHACAVFIFRDLQHEPRRVGTQLRTPPLDGVWRATKGTYRVLYEIDDARGEVYVLAVQHRADVYR